MEQKEERTLRALPISFEIYAYDEQEAEDARQAIIGFIEQHRRQNRAVTARKVADAIRRWDTKFLIRNEVIKYFT